MTRISDRLLDILTYFFSSLGVIALVWIVSYVFSNGVKHFSWSFITGDYLDQSYSLISDRVEGNYSFEQEEGVFYSNHWGIGLQDSLSQTGSKIVKIVYVDHHSPMKTLIQSADQSNFEIKEGHEITKVSLVNDEGKSFLALSKMGAQSLAETLDKGNRITDMLVNVSNGGIRGSLITTFYMIALTLIFVIPLGICSAIYLNEYASTSKLGNILSSMIDMTSGIPSIIFGLAGAMIFIPLLTPITKQNGGSILSGALTLTMMLLPVVIKTTKESLLVIPDSLRNASLALGASQTQTILKVVLPCALPGILTSILLCIGRIVGESAALIYAVGTVIKDEISIFNRSSTLAVHIYSILGGESPNFDLACTISMVILIFVFILNVLVKWIGKKMNRLENKA